MVTFVAVGTFFVAAGPALAVTFVFLLPNPHLVVLSTIAAFVWSIALSISGTVYWMIPPLRETYAWLLFVVVTAQELMRLALFELFRYMFKSGDGVQAFLRPGVKNDTLTGLSVGTGFAILSVMVNFYSAVIDEFRDDTAIYTDKCPINFFLVSSLNALAFSILHMVLGVFVWPAYARRSWSYILAAYALHLGVSEVTLLNRREQGCEWGLGVVFALVGLALAGTGFLARTRVRKEAS